MNYCEYCGRTNLPQCKQGWEMCVDCAALYKRYSDLRHKVKNGDIKAANRADKKLMQIVDIYKERAARGLRVPKTLGEYSPALNGLHIMGLCNWCGRTHVPRHSKHKQMCVDCGKMYSNFMNARTTINNAVKLYKQRKEMGCEVPIVLNEYIK